MKRMTAIVCVAILLFSTVCLSGCGLDGQYKLISKTVDDYSFDVNDPYVSSPLTIKGDTATAVMKNEFSAGDHTIVYVIDKKSGTFSTENETFRYRVDGKRLTLSNEATVMVYEKQ